MLDPINKKKLSTSQINRFRDKYRKEIISTSSRCVINKIEYHSLNWHKIGRNNNMTICYKSGQEENFGDIDLFFLYEGTIYAIVNVFSTNND